VPARNRLKATQQETTRCDPKEPRVLTRELPVPESRVLSTLHEDGSRRWMHPRPAFGRFLRARRILAYVLIGIFTLTPYVSIQGKPAILLNIPAREFTLFGFTFLPTDTLLLALLLVSLILGIFLVTALFGRVWCGWMCPQTVYMEFVYRPLERLFDGPPGPRHAPGRRATPVRTVLKYAAYLIISALLAHTFLAYFVGVESLAQWVRRSPFEHPTSFLVMLVTTGAMLFDFVFFREQTCIVACPYGRLQSVMLDRNSMIVSYDPQRGEPRARGRRTPGDGLGDCVDCGWCTDTCPTGIDIREGLQLECIACTQCMDACDEVMERLGQPRGLIRFSSQARISGERGSWLRPRVIVYPAVILLLLTAFGVVLAGKQPADVTLLRGLGVPFTQLTPGEITNQLRVKIKNRSGEDASYSITITDREDAWVTLTDSSCRVAAGESRTEPVLVALPKSAFQGGHCDVTVRVSDGDKFQKDLTYRLLGPRG
jgi:cytochrome c oxidase accessory protein FixG